MIVSNSGDGLTPGTFARRQRPTSRIMSIELIPSRIRLVSPGMSSGRVSNSGAKVDGDVSNAEQLLDDFVNEILDGMSAKVQSMSGNTGEYGAMPQLVNAQRLPWFHSVRLLATNSPMLTNPTLRADHKSAYHRKEPK